ncbi:MAG: acyltransferase [Chitinophagaceae bacterium]|nr:acyltransferase [Chitinophagaceae bacterium]
MKRSDRSSEQYLKSLDFLRAIAILLVIYWHYIICGISDSNSDLLLKLIKKTGSWTWSGVDLFFVISGFLIGRILLLNRGAKNFFKAFYIKRFLRIFPLYYLIVCAYFLIALFFLDENVGWLFQKEYAPWVYLLFLQNFFIAETGFLSNWLNVTWSLAVEEQFYLLLPLIIHFLPRKVILSIAFSGVIIAFFYRLLNTGLGSYVLLIARMDALLTGVIIAYYYIRKPFLFVRPLVRVVLQIVPLIIFLGLIMVCLFSNLNYNGGAWIHLILTMLYGSLLFNAVYGFYDSLWKHFDYPIISNIAKYSYCIYLIHQIVNGFVHDLILGNKPLFETYASVLLTCLSIIITYIFSGLSYKYFERPLLNIGKKISYQ